MKEKLKKKRIEIFGEVFTPDHISSQMLNLCDEENKRIDSKFLEPACGDGVFLTKVLKNIGEKSKVSIRNIRRECNDNIKNLLKNKITLLQKYKKNQIEFEKNLFISSSSVYGIEILKDNVFKCRDNLYSIIEKNYKNNYKNTYKNSFLISIKEVLKINIVWGDAIKLINLEKNLPITFSNWSFVSEHQLKRSEYQFKDLLAYQPFGEGTLFSDLGDKVIVPEPIKDYKIVNFLELNYD